LTSTTPPRLWRNPLTLATTATGVASGVLVVWLAALASEWWRINFGDIVTVSLSPFDYEVMLLNQVTSVPLIDLVVLISRIIAIVAGVLLIISAVKPLNRWSKKLIEYSWSKIPSYFVVIILIARIMTAIVSKSTAGIEALVRNWFPVESIVANGEMFFTGSMTLTVTAHYSQRLVILDIPVTASFGSSFYVAIVTTALCGAYRVLSYVAAKRFSKASAQGQAKV